MYRYARRRNAKAEPASAAPAPAARQQSGARWDLTGVPAFPRAQPRLRIGAANDPAEREADRIADGVMAGPVAAPTARAAAGINRKCMGCGEEEEAKPPVLRKADGAAAAAGGTASAAAEAAVGDLGAGAALAGADRAFFEARFGRDFSNVRIHDGQAAAAASQAMAARAFTLGSDIAFARGEYRPGTSEGRRLIAHELTHTLQQEGGARRTVQRQQQAGVAQEGHLTEAMCATEDGCDFQDGTGTATGKFTLTIYADKEGPFLLIPLTEDVGHSWLRLEDDKGNYWTYGFWPQTGFDSSESSKAVEGCVHSPDRAHAKHVTSSQTFELTADQFAAAHDYAKSTCKSRPSYKLFSYNCTTFVTETLAKAGQGSFGGFGLIWESPNALDKWMRVHALQIGANFAATSSAPGGAGAGSFAFDLSYRHQFYSMLGNKLRLYGVGQTELGSPIKTLGAGVGASLDPQKVYLPAFYLEGMGTLGDMNPLAGQDKFGAGVQGAAGLRYNIDAFGSIGVEYNVLKDVVSDDPALGRMMVKLGLNLW
jgi:uncharacterized protein DUF4157